MNRPLLKRHSDEAVADFAGYWELYCEMIGRDSEVDLPIANALPTDRRKVVVLCDIHGSFDPHVFRAAVDEGAHEYWLAGDVLNLFAFSRFKDGLVRQPESEIGEIRAGLEVLLQETGAQVKIIEGNHDRRAWTYFASRVDDRFMPLVKYDLLSLIALDLPQVEVVRTSIHATTPLGHTEETALENRYLAWCGRDAVIAHLEIARKGEGRTVDAVSQWINQWRLTAGWVEPKLIIQAHIHRACVQYPFGGHLVLVEGGYSGRIDQYTQEDPKYPVPTKGYAVFCQNQKEGEWYSDLSSVFFRLC